VPGRGDPRQKRIPASAPGEEPLLTCNRCEIPQPRSAFWKDRSRGADGVSRTCIACTKARLRAADARRDMAKAEQRAIRAQEIVDGTRAPKPERPLKLVPAPKVELSLRGMFEEAVKKDWPKIAKRASDLAAKGDRQMLRLVLAYTLGKPPDQTSEDGLGDFFRTVLEAAAGGYPGNSGAGAAVRADSEGALDGGGLLADGEPGYGPELAESPGDDLPEGAGRGRDSEWEVDDYRG